MWRSGSDRATAPAAFAVTGQRTLLLQARLVLDKRKVKIALRLRRETVMTMDWIAERLQMGCRHTLANCLKGR